MKPQTSTIQTELDKAHSFSADLHVESKQLARVVEELLEKLYEHSKPLRQQRAKHLPQLDVLVLNLLKAADSSGKAMALSRSPSSYRGNVSYRILVKHHLDTLIEMRWLHLHKGYRLPQTSRVSRVTLRKPLVDWLRKLDDITPDIDRSAPTQVLTLKDEKKNPIEITEELHSEAEKLSAGTHKINEHLEKTNIDLFLDDYDLEDLQIRMSEKAKGDPFAHAYLDLTKRYLRRIFNNGSLQQGGRFYDGWWQSIPSEYRQYISLNGDYVVELDYSSIHIHLLYSLIQQTCHMEDHYVFGKLSKQWRPITKKMVNILINAKSRESAIKAAKNQGLFDNGFPDGISDISDYIKEIYFHHDDISTFFSTGYGVRLQFLDSQIAEAVMLRMLPEPCLPVHDSFIVRSGQQEWLEQVMNEEFQAATGIEAGIKSTVIELTDARKSVIQELIEDELNPYSQRLYRWRLKYQYKYFIRGVTSNDVPILKA